MGEGAQEGRRRGRSSEGGKGRRGLARIGEGS